MEVEISQSSNNKYIDLTKLERNKFYLLENSMAKWLAYFRNEDMIYIRLPMKPEDIQSCYAKASKFDIDIEKASEIKKLTIEV